MSGPEGRSSPEPEGRPAPPPSTEGAGAPTPASNFAWLVASDIVGKAASLVFVVVVARRLGAEPYGYYTFAVTFVGLALLCGRWGIGILVQRSVAASREGASRLVGSAIALRLMLAFVSLVVAFLTAPAFTRSPVAFLVVVVIGLALALDELVSVFSSAFNAVEQMRYPAIVLSINRIGSTAVAVVVLAFGGQIVAVAFAYALGSATSALLAYVLLLRRVVPTTVRSANRETVAWFLREGAPLGVAELLNAAIFRVDGVMLQALRGAVAVGMYGVAYRFFESLLFVVWSVSTAIFPRVARLGASKSSLGAFQAAVTLLLATYLPIAAGAPFASHWLLSVLFGDEFAAAAGAVNWLSVALALYGLGYLCRYVLLALGERSRVTVIAAAVLGVNVLANLLLIPRFSFTGAAAATALTAGLEVVLVAMLLLRHARGWFGTRLLAVPVASTALMVIVLSLTDSGGPAAVVLGLLVYVGSLGIGFRIVGDDLRRVVRVALGSPSRSSHPGP